MSTDRQIAANRLNALHSTGPRTPAGKAVSSQNAFKSGLDSHSQFAEGETSEDFQLLQQEYMDEYRPINPRERLYVDTLIRNEWTLRRLARGEAHLWEYHTIRASRSEGVPLGYAWCTADKSFMRLQRRITLTEQSIKEAFAELDRLIAARPPVLAVPEPQVEASAPQVEATEPQTEVAEPQAEAPEPPPQPQQDNSPTAELGLLLHPPVEPAPEPQTDASQPQIDASVQPPQPLPPHHAALSRR